MLNTEVVLLMECDRMEGVLWERARALAGPKGFAPVENVFQGGEFSGWCVGALGLWSFPVHGLQLTAWGGESWF